MSTEKTTLTSKDICLIIEICGKWGVREFKLEGLSFSFSNIKETNTFTPIPAPLDQTENKTQIDEQSFVKAQEVLSKEEELANMLLENPQEYEDMLLTNDLEDKGEDDVGAKA